MTTDNPLCEGVGEHNRSRVTNFIYLEVQVIYCSTENANDSIHDISSAAPHGAPDRC